MVVKSMMNNRAYEYCKKSIELETTPKYVKLQMQDFIDICDGKMGTVGTDEYFTQ